MNTKLIAARAEIEAILRKYDIAYWAVLHNAPGEIEVFSNLQPSYSILRLQLDEQGALPPVVRVVSKLTDYGGDVAKQMHDQAATANMLSGFAEIMGGTAIGLIKLSGIVDEAVGAEHGTLRSTIGKGH